MLGTASSPAWADIEKDAASWNSLLTWAREQRGPQWDAGSGTWQVPRESALYYGLKIPDEVYQNM
ncbi:hypothetical protein ACI68E_000523 [Malassezia pachydermatis]